MIHEAYMPVYMGSRFLARDGTDRGSTRGPRGPKKYDSLTHSLTDYLKSRDASASKNTCNFDMPRTSDVNIQNAPKIEMKKDSAKYGLTLSKNTTKKYCQLGDFSQNLKSQIGKNLSILILSFLRAF